MEIDLDHRDLVLHLLDEIRITNTVENDLDLVTGYIAEVLQNPTAADKLLELAEKTVNQIGFTPYMFSLSEDETLAEKDYRNVVLYVFLYTPSLPSPFISSR